MATTIQSVLIRDQSNSSDMSVSLPAQIDRGVTGGIVKRALSVGGSGFLPDYGGIAHRAFFRQMQKVLPAVTAPGDCMRLDTHT